MSLMSQYLGVLKKLRLERGEFCEACGLQARHGHHIIPVSETGIHVPLFLDERNIMILCDDCHLLMHPMIRRPEWATVRKGRGLAILRG